jgi:serine/threonine protein kinase
MKIFGEKKASPMADMYALGAVLLMMLTNDKTPVYHFEGNAMGTSIMMKKLTLEGIAQKVAESNKNRLKKIKNKELAGVVEGLLESDPERRLTANQVVDKLKAALECERQRTLIGRLSEFDFDLTAQIETLDAAAGLGLDM